MDGYCTDSTLLISFSIDIIYTDPDSPIPLFTLIKSNMKPGRKLNNLTQRPWLGIRFKKSK